MIDDTLENILREIGVVDLSSIFANEVEAAQDV